MTNTMNRFQQRYQNFHKAYMSFVRIYQEHAKVHSETNEMALIQAFEFTFELSWKLLKTYLELEGIITKSPRQAIKHAFQQEIIEEGDIWLQAMAVRNETVHTYDDAVRHKAANFIADKFAPKLQKLHGKMKEKNEVWTL